MVKAFKPWWAQNKLLLLPTLSFGLLSLVFISTKLSWLSFVALIPFVYFLSKSQKFTNKQIVRSIYWSGLLYCLVVFAWELQTTPNSWTELQGPLIHVSKILVWLLCASFFSIGFWLLARFVVRMRKNPSVLILSLPFAWALFEFIRTYVFAFLSYGPGGSLSPNWNLGVIGLGITPSIFGNLSRFVGLYGLSVIAVGVNVMLFYVLFKRSAKVLRLSFAVLALLCLVSFAGHALYQPNSQPVRVGAVHLETKDGLETWDKPALPAETKELDVLVLPEYSLFFNNPDYHAFAKKHFGDQTTIITSTAGKTRPAENILTFYAPAQGIFSQQAKTFLVSAGEYMPYLMNGFFKLIGQDYLNTTFNDSQQVKRGARAEQVVQTPNLVVGSLVCSGVLALNEYRNLSRSGAEILTNSASLSLISRASLYHEQESYLTRFHAKANARPFIQASRSGESYILSHQGDRLAHATGDTQLLTSTVQSSNKRTLYSLLGEWMLLVSTFMVVAALWRTRPKA